MIAMMTTLKQPFTIYLRLCALLASLAATPALAIDSQDLPDIKEGYVTIKTVEPTKRVGYTVGDVIEREVVLNIKAPYKLIETSMPIPGYEKRYRGQLIGIELKSIQHEKEVLENSTRHEIKLAYQVFTNNVVAKNASLGPEYLHLINTTNKQDLVKYRIPSLDIAISPIAIFGQVKIENNMSTFYGPFKISSAQEQHRLKIAIAILVLSMLGLLYILGKHAWLPRMGGSFARTYRKIRKLPETQAGLAQAVSHMHQAFNHSAGLTVFSHNVDEFITRKPNFAPLRSEILQFFAISRQVYFEPNAAHGLGNAPVAWLKGFCRRCRDCERGLTPETAKVKG
jgi:mxaA protein